MVQALCRPNGAGPYSRSGSTKAKLAVPSLYPATSVTFGGLYRASAHNVPNLSTPGASEETPKIDAIGSDRGAVAVGTRVSSHAPRPEPYVRLSRIRLSPRVCDGKASAWPRMEGRSVSGARRHRLGFDF